MSANFYYLQPAPIAIGLLNNLWDRVTAQLLGNSTTSLTLSAATKSLTIETDKQFALGQSVRITNNSDLAKWMQGTVASYNASTGALVVSVDTVSGTGSAALWTVSLAGGVGPAGPTGPAGGTGPAGATGGTGPSNSLSIGTVTNGTAAASITGTAPAQVLNLVLPTGPTGNTGVAPWQTPPVAWATATPYTATAPASSVVYQGESYVCSVAHTSSGSFDAAKFTKIAAKGADGLGAGTVTNVTGAAPIQVASGTSTPVISIDAATTSLPGSMSAADKTKLNGIASGAQVNPTNTDALTEGATNLYATAARTLATVLAGLSTASGTVVTAAHTILQAIGFLQKQVSDNTTSIGGKQATLVSGTSIKTINSTSLLGSGDIVVSTSIAPLVVESANVISQRNGTNGQRYNNYNTYTDASNYERVSITWSSNVAYLRPEKAGTGASRLLIPVTGATVVASLPSASTAGAGARAFVTDATFATFLNTVSGGGNSKVPVVSDGTNWLIG